VYIDIGSADECPEQWIAPGAINNGAPNGIPYIVVNAGQPKVPVSSDYADESDPGPYPIPANAPIEGGPRKLYELFDAHPADGGAALPPMGMRVRLKSTFDTTGFSPNVRVVLRAMMKYGMLLADNGSGWFFSGAPDPRWNEDELATFSRVPSSAFEAVILR
jgi:hypothetical protein